MAPQSPLLVWLWDEGGVAVGQLLDVKGLPGSHPTPMGRGRPGPPYGLASGFINSS